MFKSLGYKFLRSIIASTLSILALCLANSCSKNEAPPQKSASVTAEIKTQKLSSNNNSQDSAKTLFVPLSPEESGIKSKIEQIPNHPYSFFYNTGFEASGVAVGDIDRDGLPDLFLASSPGGNRLYRQVSPLKFEDITQGSGLENDNAWGRGASLIDIDNDGDLDIYVANYGQANSLYINEGPDSKGKITFTEKAKSAGIATSDASLMPSFCDYDMDGDLDLYLATNEYRLPPSLTPPDPKKMIGKDENGRPFLIPPYNMAFKLLVKKGPKGPMLKWDKIGRPDYLYQNNGDGTFTDVTKKAGIITDTGRGLSATWWDYNDDGLPDIYIGNDWGDRDYLYHNNGDGTFRDAIEEAVPYTTMFSMGADAGDLNNDGRTDFIIADMSGTTHYKRKISMGNMEASATEFMLKARPPQNMRNAVYYGTGTRRALESAYLVGMANSDWTWSVKIDDLNNDGLSDVFYTNGMEQNIREVEDGETINPTETQDLRKENNLVFQNKGNFKFAESGKDWGLDHFGFSLAAVNCDFDRDGDIDVFVMHRDEAPILYKNNTKNPGTLVKLNGTTNNRDGVGSKITIETDKETLTRTLNIARGYLSADESIAHFGVTNDTKIEKLTVKWPSGQSQEFENLVGGNLYEITEKIKDSEVKSSTPVSKASFTLNPSLSATRHKEIIFDDFEKQPLLPNKLSQLGPGMAVGDLDGDNDDDLIMGGGAGSPTQVIINKGNGNFASPTPIKGSEQYEDMGVLLMDFDQDNDLDLFCVSGGVESSGPALQDRLYINDGNGNFSLNQKIKISADTDSGGPVSCADVDRDGDLDLFIGSRVVPGKYPTSTKSRLLINNKGSFIESESALPSSVSELGMVTGSTFTDLNNDGWQDLIISIEWGPLTYLENENGKFVNKTKEAKLSEITGWWNGVTSADLDQDGDMDLIATNFGLNTKYHTSADHPVLLYYGKFGTEEMRLVEAEYENGQLFPVRGKSCSTRAIPQLADRFNTFHSFALAELNEIYSPKEMDQTQKFSIVELNSGVFINDGEGKFEFKELPKIAQLAPGFGIVAEDLDGDNITDLFIAQNFHWPQPETGRMSGGMSVILKGNGDGSFNSAWPQESGIIVPDDAKSVCLSDFNGDSFPDLVISSNDGPLRGFLSVDKGQKKNYTVTLKGSIQNAQGIGAKIIAIFSDNSKVTKEIKAGSGYLSQSSNKLNFSANSKELIKFNIIWPTGETTEHPIDGVEKNLIFEQPEA